MKRLLQIFSGYLVLCLTLTNVVCAGKKLDENQQFFEDHIRPLLMQRCAECHGPDDQSGGLRLDARSFALKGGDGGPVLKPGVPAESELWKRVTSRDESERMPPEGDPLSAEQIDRLRVWIQSGAVWPESDYDREAAIDRRLEHWAFQPLTLAPDAEQARTAQEKAARLDRFVSERLVESGIRPNGRADRRTLIRRLSFDLLGLPPSPDEVRRFTESTEPDAWERLVESRLESPRYGERWAQHWLDVVRYADTHGFEVNTPRENAWPYRDYVIRSLNEDKPYDQFILEQLAGDVLGADEATGFLVAAAVLLPGQIGKDEESKRLARQDALDEIIQGTGATLLGLTIGCARCHDHKFDPITQSDYYAMQAFFAGVEYGDRPIRDAEFERRQAELTEITARIDELQRSLIELEPLAWTDRMLIIDEEDDQLVERLKPANGPGANPPGTDRGHRDDPGTTERIGNISRGRYTWWNNTPGEDVLAYRPGVDGTFRLWISWGAHGSGVHTRDARYVLDDDGNPATRGDQRELARVDQYYPAGVTAGETAKQPLWSGLRDVGLIDLKPDSCLLVRGGETGTGITADVIVLQEEPPANAPQDSEVQWPRLRAPVDPRMNTERFAPTSVRHVRFTSLETIDNNRHEPCLDELEVFGVDDPSRNLALASHGSTASSSGNISETGKHQLPHINDGRYGNSFSWISNEPGRGWVQITLPQVAVIDRIVWGRDREGQFPDRLPVRYQIDVSIDGTTWQTVATAADRVPQGAPFDPVQATVRALGSDASAGELKSVLEQVEQLRKRKQQLETPRMAYAGVFREPDQTYVLRRGDPEQRVEEIGPSVPVLFSQQLDPSIEQDSTISGEQQRRLAFARWLSSPENPLTARVMVNRIWQYHFGHGIVDTSSDFGLNGARPTHPELLDWLASEFISSGWSIKHVHRLILLSETYQRSHQLQPEAQSIDRDNRLLWRFQSRRLEAEAIRDGILAVTGELNLEMGGPGFNFFQTRGGLSGFPPVEQFGPQELRRMVYAHRIRMEPVPVFGAFDCPDAGQATPRRSQSTTAIQALNLFNSSFVIERAVAFAKRIERELPDEDPAVTDSLTRRRIERAFELALTRLPTQREMSAAFDVVRQHELSTLCRVLLNCNEFLFLP